MTSYVSHVNLTISVAKEARSFIRVITCRKMLACSVGEAGGGCAMRSDASDQLQSQLTGLGCEKKKNLVNSHRGRSLHTQFMLGLFSAIYKVHEINHYWTWMNNTFIPSLVPTMYYDNLTTYDSGYLADVPTAWVLGVARLRQLRMRKGTRAWFKSIFN